MRTLLKASLVLCGVLLVGGCGSSKTADTNATVTAIATGIKAAGTGMTGVRAAHHGRLNSGDCQAHGVPSVNNSDGNYPGFLTYCYLTVNDGDTILGGFSTASSVSCLLTQAGVPFDNSSHTVTITDAMIAACNMDGSGLTNGMTMTVATSTPASFNANYDTGAVIDLSSSIGLTFKIATKTSGSKVTFITNESWSDLSVGSTSGTLDQSTGDLWYESRVERMNCVASGRCGWSRHTRIHALLTMSGTTPTGLTSLTFAYSNIQTTPGQSGFGGQLVTASGALATGIKARFWNNNASAASDYNTVSNWVETTNTHCYTAASDNASCGSNTGLAGMATSTKFALNTTDSHVNPADWLTSITGQTFTNVVVDTDTQF